MTSSWSAADGPCVPLRRVPAGLSRLRSRAWASCGPRTQSVRCAPLFPRSSEPDHHQAGTARRDLDGRFGHGHVLARAVVLVRKALRDDSRVARYVQTVPTRGYKFIAPSFRTSEAQAPCPEHDGADRPDSWPITLAVLPFVNASDNAGTEHFLEGISEDILNALAHDHTLRVAARSSSFAFRGGTIDVRTVGEQLQVAFVLDGASGARETACASQRNSSTRRPAISSGVSGSIGHSPTSSPCRTTLRCRRVCHTRGPSEETHRSAAWCRERAPQAAETAAQPRRVRRVSERALSQPSAFRGHGRGARLLPARLALDPRSRRYAALAETMDSAPCMWHFRRWRRSSRCDGSPRKPRSLIRRWRIPTICSPASRCGSNGTSPCDRHLRRALAIEPNHTGALKLAAICRCCAAASTGVAGGRPGDACRSARPGDAHLGARGGVLHWRFRTSNHRSRAANRRAPRVWNAFRWRSMVYTAVGEDDRARSDLETFGAETNMHLFALVGLGIVAALEGKTVEARRLMDAMRERSAASGCCPWRSGRFSRSSETMMSPSIGMSAPIRRATFCSPSCTSIRSFGPCRRDGHAPSPNILAGWHFCNGSAWRRSASRWMPAESSASPRMPPHRCRATSNEVLTPSWTLWSLENPTLLRIASVFV